MDGTHVNRNVLNGTLLSSAVFELNACNLGVFVAGHQVNTALGQLLKEVTRLHFNVEQVAKLFGIALNQFQIQRSNLED